MAPKRQATQTDVAKAAEVSQALVSLVLSGAPVDVSDTTRLRIQEEARRLRYVPKKKKTRSGAQKLIGYIRPQVVRGHHNEEWIYASYDEYYGRIQNLLVEEAHKAGCLLVVHPLDQRLPDSEVTQWLSEWNVSGVICQFLNNPLSDWIAKRYPTVKIGLPLPNADVVSPDYNEVITFALDYLTSRGHQRIAISSSSQWRDIRFGVYKEYMMQRGLPIISLDEKNEGIIIDAHIDFALNGPKENRLTAFLAGDHTALRLIKRARERGLSIPDDFSVIGIDNISGCVFSNPALTSVDPQNHDIARIAVALMMSRIQSPESGYQKVYVTPKLIERESVGIVASSEADAPAISGA